MSGLNLHQIKKSYGQVDIIHGVDLDIEHGEFVVFVGPSGCGKSTLLRLIAGLEDISDGTLSIGGKDVTNSEPGDRGVAMVFQSYALYPHMTARDNMGFGLRMTGSSKESVDKLVDRASEILHLGPLMDRKPKAMSGGQRQRVAIGRAIVRDPQVFLFDEPLSNLDAELRVQMRLEIAKLHQELNATMIYVTHDQVEAMTMADKIVVLRDGVIEQVGSPLKLYDNPDNQFVAGFIGSPKMNFLNGKIEKQTASKLFVHVHEIDCRLEFNREYNGQLDTSDVIVGIRPEHFRTTGDVKFETKIDVIENLGGTSFAYCGADEIENALTIELHGDRSAKEQSKYKTGFNIEDVFIFDKRTGKRIR